MTISVPSEHKNASAPRLIAMLERLAEREDRAALAALRRGLGKPPGGAPEMFPYVVPCLAPTLSRWDEQAAYLIASLFALHPASWNPAEPELWRSNFGASFRRLTIEVESESLDQRFVALLNCHRDDLPDHLRHAVGLLRTREIPVNWGQLLHDIRFWEGDTRRTQRDWARTFWGAAADRPTAEGERMVAVAVED